MTKKIRTLLIGTSSFAVPVFEALNKSDLVEVVGVVTQPDRPVGRHQSELEFSAVKKWVVKDLTDKAGVLNLKLFQPEKLKIDAENILDETKPELIVVASYGQMVPKNMIDYPKFKCLNVHASLLPDLRGAVPMPMAILKGYRETGVSIPIMTPGLDDGDLIGQTKFAIAADETTESLTVKSSMAGAKLLVEILPDWIDGKIKPIPQDESKVTHCNQEDISKEKAELLPTDSAIEIDRKVRSLYPWPVAWAFLRSPEDKKKSTGIEAVKGFAGKRLKVFKTKIYEDERVIKKNLKLYKWGEKLMLRADVGWLEITECQLEGKNRLLGHDYTYLAIDRAESVRGILIHDEKILLMFRRKMGKEYYTLPGGSVGINESHEEALKREMKEETNTEIKIGEHVYTDQEEIGGHGFFYNHYAYICELTSDPSDIRIVGEEKEYDQEDNHYEPRWVELNKLSEIFLYQKDRILKAIKK